MYLLMVVWLAFVKLYSKKELDRVFKLLMGKSHYYVEKT